MAVKVDDETEEMRVLQANLRVQRMKNGPKKRTKKPAVEK
jgi:hypothetical protein